MIKCVLLSHIPTPSSLKLLVLQRLVFLSFAVLLLIGVLFLPSNPSVVTRSTLYLHLLLLAQTALHSHASETQLMHQGFMIVSERDS